MLIKMCLNEIFSIIRLHKRLPRAFSFQDRLKAGCTLLPWLFNLALKYVIRMVQENHDGFELIGTRQLLVCGSDGNLLGVNVNTMDRNTESL
jgi:hypothetical protein